MNRAAVVGMGRAKRAGCRFLCLGFLLCGAARPAPLAAPRADHSVGNPGNVLDLLFLLSCDRAAQFLKTVPWATFPASGDDSVRAFLVAHHDSMAADLGRCDLRFTDAVDPVDLPGVDLSCARTNVDPAVYPQGQGGLDTVFLSRPSCTAQGVDEATAVEVLTHEMVHHVVDAARSDRPDGRITDETFCNAVAAFAYRGWQELLATTPKKWVPKPALVGSPSQRAQHAAIWTGATGDAATAGRMVVWGGCSPSAQSLFGCGQYFRSGAAYDLASNTWAPLDEASAPDERALHTAVWTGSSPPAHQMIVWGGCNGSASCFNSLATGGMLDVKTGKWTALPVSAATPTARVHHSAVWTPSGMLVFGGESGYQSPDAGVPLVALGDGAAYLPAAGASGWRALRVAGAPSPRGQHTAVWTGQEMLVWGGCDRRGIRTDGCADFKADGARYDPVRDVWRPLTSNSDTPSGRFGHTAVWTGRYMAVWGGVSHDGSENSGGLYDPALDKWIPMSPFGPSPRARHTSVWTGVKMLVWGGTSGVGSPVPLDLGEFIPPQHPDQGDSGDWSVVRFDAAPEVTLDATAVWADDGMIVWGGTSADDRFTDRGGLYQTPNSLE